MAPACGSESDFGEHKLTTLSKNAALPKWTFGTAPRFMRRPGEPPTGKRDPESHNQSTTTLATNVPASSLAGEAISDTECEPSRDAVAEVSRVGQLSRATTWSGPWSVGSGFHRLDTSTDRFLEPPERAANPRPKQYDPCTSIGDGVSVSYQHTPKYSFGGGKSRLGDMEKEKRILAVQKETRSGDQKKNALQALIGQQERSVVKQLEDFKKEHQRCSNGFGTAQRLRYRGGPMEMPESPGPAAYELARGMDLLPQWSPDTIVPYGKRTGQRPPCRNYTASNVGPGEYTAHHTMQAYKSSPLFGHPLRTHEKDLTPAPGQYEQGTSVGQDTCGSGFFPQPGYSMMARRDPLKADDKPGPGTYDPDLTGVVAETYCATFGRAARTHESDMIDPDEPPGPGAHRVRVDPKASDKPSVGMPRAPRMKKTVSSCVPGPGNYPTKSTFSTRSVGVALPLPKPQKWTPGPFEYSPNVDLTRETPFAWASPARTSKRTPFGAGFNEEPSGSQVEVKMERPVHGPKWSMGCRRDDHIMFGDVPAHHASASVPPDRENHHGLYGAYGSVTPRRASSPTKQKAPRRAAAVHSVGDSEN